MGSDDEMQTVKPLREPLELNPAHFSPFELSLLEVASPLNLVSNRVHSPISPFILLSTYSFNNTHNYPDTETAASLMRTQLLLKLNSQSYTPPLSTASPSASQAYPGTRKEESLKLLHLEMRPLKEPLEMDSSHFSPFELSLLEVASPVNLVSNRAHSSISPSILLSTYSFNNTQDFPDTETAA
jgi:hypothetical protein